MVARDSHARARAGAERERVREDARQVRGGDGLGEGREPALKG